MIGQIYRPLRINDPLKLPAPSKSMAPNNYIDDHDSNINQDIWSYNNDDSGNSHKLFKQL